MMLCYSKTRKIKYFLDPPPKKKAHGYERSRYVYTHKCLSIPAVCDLAIQYMKEMVSEKISPKNEKNSQIKIASAHIHIPRNNPAKFQKNP